MALIVNDRYAGDEAWQDWFAICSVAGCGAENAAKLRKQVENAMFAQLARYGPACGIHPPGGDGGAASKVFRETEEESQGFERRGRG